MELVKTSTPRKRRTKTLASKFDQGEGDKLSRNVSVRQELQKLVNAVRSKFKLLRQSADRMQTSAEIGAKPLIKPLQEAVTESIKVFAPLAIKKEIKTEEEKEEQRIKEEEQKKVSADATTQTQKTDLASKYIERLSDPAYKDKLDFIYGVRADGTGGLMIGDSKVTFSKSKLQIKNNTFDITQGLLELLFMKVPNKTLYNRNDLQQYKRILVITNAHLQSYSVEKRVNSNVGKKYTTVISPLFYPKTTLETPTSPTSSGSGIRFTSYNDNVNMLVNRLRLLVLSSSAGHTGHDAEISRIINVLRDNRIVA